MAALHLWWLGATFFSADTVASETKLSADVGGGVKFFPWRSVGVRAHVRYKADVSQRHVIGRLLRAIRLLSERSAAGRVCGRGCRAILISSADSREREGWSTLWQSKGVKAFC
jgi:hypothetical protein